MKKEISKHKNLIKGIVAFALFFSADFIYAFTVHLFNINTKNMGIKTATIISCISSIIISILLVILYRKDLIKEWKVFKKKLSDNLDIGFKYWMIGLGLMVVSNLIINYVFKAGQANNEEAVQSMISAVPYLVLISAGICAPITEEIVFRKVFKDNIKNKIIYILAAGLIFGYLHVCTAESLAQFLYIIPYSSLGLCFAISYLKTDTVFTSMSMHMMHNTILTIVSILI